MLFQLAILLTAFITLTSGAALDWKSQQNAWENSGQFEGDIKLTESQMRNGLIATTYRWPSRTVPYLIASHFTASQRAAILKAIDEYHQKTCIRLREYNSATDRDYVYIKGDESGCWSYVGRIGNRQALNLGPGCFTHGTIAHEILHALGFYHQQSATNRDNYVTIQWDNIQSGTESNFNKYDANRITDYNVAYDYGSVMHYSAYAFSKNGLRTIVTKDPYASIGQRVSLSASDILKLEKMYGCQ